MNPFRNVLAATASAIIMVMAPQAQAETLADALIAAYKHSNLLEQNRSLLRVADEDVAIAVAELRPIIAFSTSATYNFRETTLLSGRETTTDSLTAAAELTWQLNIFDNGRGALAVASAKENVLATRASLVNVEQQVLLSAVQAYVNVWLSQEIVALRQSNLRLITQELRAAQDRFDVGEITRTDVALAESRLGASRASLAAAEGDLAVAREAYKASTGAYPRALAGLPRAPRLPASLADARALALRSHPLLRQAQHLVSAAEINVGRTRAELGPRVSGTAAVGLQQGGVESNSFRLSLNQPIYSGGQLSAYIRRANAARDAQRSSLHQTAVSIEQNVGVTWSRLEVAAASIAANLRQIEAAQIAFDGLREEAKLGARTTLDVLDAEQELLDARAAKLSSEAERYYSVYAMLNAMGLLTVEGLNLGIPTYDVTAYYNAVKDAPVTSFQGRSLDRVLKAIGKE